MDVQEETRNIQSRLVDLKDKLVAEPTRTHILVGAAALAVGAGVGYVLGKRNKYEAIVEIDSDIHDDPNQMKFEFDSEELAQELADIREYTEEVREKRIHAMPAVDADGDIRPGLIIEEEREEVEDLVMEDRDAVEDFVAQRLQEAMTTSNGSLEMEEPEVVSIFTVDDGSWDYEEEVRNRSVTEPYILHVDEFFADEKNYHQMTLTYYSGDNILVDEDETPVYNHQFVTGDLRFGHGSKDKSVVYIRNDKRKAEYEVILHEGLFSEEVLGLHIENNQRRQDLKHSDYRKFRQTE